MKVKHYDTPIVGHTAALGRKVRVLAKNNIDEIGANKTFDRCPYCG